MVKLVNMVDYKLIVLKKEKFIMVVVLIYGEGELLEDVESFYEFLMIKKVLKLDGVKVVVIGLGDLSYEFFC